ncbi:MAG: DUF1353 domain-containing protein [Sphaerochaeta sp.]|jgi:hypothetical protein|nr:DUF1353 domain-containing protein [Sphaerochaeta sp.]
MGKSFIAELAVTPLQSGRKWKLLRAFTFHVGSKAGKERVQVPAGFVTDFASVPKPFLPLIPFWGKYSKSPILHDYLYRNLGLGRYTRKECDQIFLESMLVDWRHHKFGLTLALTEYYGVRCFGWLSWKGDK